MSRSVVFLQRRTHRAGAQTCLARVMGHPLLREWRPALVCSESGWLVSESERQGVPTILERFPSSRALVGRLFANDAFARRVVGRLGSGSAGGFIVHANDYGEGLLGLALARRLRARTVVHLRSFGMTQRDCAKYRCGAYDRIVTVSPEMQARVRGWLPDREVMCVADGLDASEFHPPRGKSVEPPRRLLVIGTPLPGKGWADVIEAVRLLESEGGLGELQLDFTGSLTESEAGGLGWEGLRRTRCVFLGRVEGFADLVRGYDLVVNPSRFESFGMAALEVLAAGVPLISTRTGVMGEVQERDDLLVPPGQPEALAAALRRVLTGWATAEFGVARCQELLRARFALADTVARLTRLYEGLPA